MAHKLHCNCPLPHRNQRWLGSGLSDCGSRFAAFRLQLLVSVAVVVLAATIQVKGKSSCSFHFFRFIVMAAQKWSSRVCPVATANHNDAEEEEERGCSPTDRKR